MTAENIEELRLTGGCGAPDRLAARIGACAAASDGPARPVSPQTENLRSGAVATFIDENSAFIVQKGIYEYSRAYFAFGST